MEEKKNTTHKPKLRTLKKKKIVSPTSLSLKTVIVMTRPGVNTYLEQMAFQCNFLCCILILYFLTQRPEVPREA